MSPHVILAELKQQGVVLSVRGGRIHGPKSMTLAQRERVQENKVGLLVALTYQCPTCDSPVRVYDREPRNYFSLECVTDPTHYSEIVKKKDRETLGLHVPLEEAIETPLQQEMGW